LILMNDIMGNKKKFKKKVSFLFSIILFLLVIYILSFVFDPAMQVNRAFPWLEPSLINQSDRIEIYGIHGMVILQRRNNVWHYLADQGDHYRELPLKQIRVEELFRALSLSYPYSYQANSMEAEIRLGLTEANASRIIVYGGTGLPLLDLLLGTADIFAREVYFRRAGRNEIYRGEDRLTIFTDSHSAFWLDLRLFPSEPDGRVFFGSAAHLPLGIGIDQVQQAEIVLPNGAGSFALFKMGSIWLISGEGGGMADPAIVESWFRSVFNAEGDDVSFNDLSFNTLPEIDGSITLWLGDNSVRSIQIGSKGEGNFRAAVTGENNLVYLLSEWTVDRLFCDSAFFSGF